MVRYYFPAGMKVLIPFLIGLKIVGCGKKDDGTLNIGFTVFIITID